MLLEHVKDCIHVLWICKILYDSLYMIKNTKFTIADITKLEEWVKLRNV